MDAFRAALTALVPIMEQAQIPWEEGKSYDDWDAIATTLFDQIVVNPINHARESSGTARLPPYDVLRPPYEGAPHLIVAERPTSKVLGPFVGLEADRHFSRLKFALAAPDGSIRTDQTGSAPYDRCSVLLRLPGVKVDLASLTLDS